MSEIAPGWYRDPAEPTTQRYWDGEGWIGSAIPADAPTPADPPPELASQTAAMGTPATVPAPAAPGAAKAAPGTTSDTGAATDAASGVGTAHDTPASGTAASGTAATGYPSGAPVWARGYPRAITAVAEVRPHGLALASVGARLVARLVDTAAVFALCVVANAWFAIELWRRTKPVLAEALQRRDEAGAASVGSPTLPESAYTLLFLIFVATTAVWFAYEVPASANSGQTLGKRLLGIKVVRLDTPEQLGLRRSFRRWGRLGLPTVLWYCCGVGFLLQVVDCLFVVIDRPLHQALHDKAAATVVVQVPRPQRSAPTSHRHGRHQHDPQHQQHQQHQHDALSPQEQQRPTHHQQSHHSQHERTQQHDHQHQHDTSSGGHDADPS